MRIGFDAKRAFYNNTGLGNYSRDSIRILSLLYPDNDYFLYTPKAKKNKRLSFLKNRETTFVRTPFSFIGNLFKKYWRSKNMTKDLLQDEIDQGIIPKHIPIMGLLSSKYFFTNSISVSINE